VYELQQDQPPCGAELQYHEIVELQPYRLLRSIDYDGALAVAVLRSDGDARLQRRLERGVGGGFGEARRLPSLRFFFRVGIRAALFEPGCLFFL
jgi:hypothetical protein